MKKDNISKQSSEKVSYDSLLKNEVLKRNRDWYYLQKICSIVSESIDNADHKDLSVLELGFNDGNRLLELSKLFRDIKFVGLEIREEPVLSMQEKGFDCRQARSELLNEEFESGEKFDVIYGIAVLHHLSDPNKSLESIIKQLKPGGALFFTREAHLYDMVSHLHTTISRKWPYEKNLIRMKRKQLKKVLSKYSTDYYVKYDNNGVTPCFWRLNSIFCKLGLHRVPLWNGMTVYAKANKEAQEGVSI